MNLPLSSSSLSSLPLPPVSSPSFVSIQSFVSDEKSEVRKRIEETTKQKKFRILSGNEPTVHALEEYYYAIQPAGATMRVHRTLGVNRTCFVTPWKTLGGSALCVWPLLKMGRLPDKPFVIRGYGSAITAFAVSAIQENLMATGNADGHVMVWDVGHELPLKEDITKPIYDLRTDGRVTSVNFHPFASNILTAADFSFEIGAVHLWDLESGNRKLSIGEHAEAIIDLQFSLDGALLGTSCKDGNIRLIDPRAGSVVAKWIAPESFKDCSVIFASDDHLLTVGSGKGSRSVSAWDLRAIRQTSSGKGQLSTHGLDASNAAPLPAYDRDHHLLFVASLGERIISVIQFDSNNGTFETLTSFQSAELITGFVQRSKLTLDPRTGTIDSFLALTKRDVVLPISFKMPRKRLEFFQDDLYPNTIDDSKAVVNSSEWLAGSSKRPALVSLQPADLPIFLSQAPPEELTQRQVAAIKAKLEAKEQENNTVGHGGLGMKSQDEVISHFRELANQGYVPKASRWDAKPDSKSEVNDDEW